MSVTLTDRAHAYREAARQVHEIELSGRPESERLKAVKHLLVELSDRTELFPPEAFPRAPGTAGGLFRLAQFPDGRGGLYMSLGFTGRGGASPHTHAGWAVVVGVSGGVERNLIYERVDDGAVEGEGRLRLKEERLVGPGDAAVIPTGAFHTIEVISETPVLHIHAYGTAVETAGDALPVFETPQSTAYTRRASGRFLPALTVAEHADVAREALHGLLAVVGLDRAPAGIAGPFVFTSQVESVTETLAGVDRRLPVVVSGVSAAEAATRLYADGRAVVFQLAEAVVSKAA